MVAKINNEPLRYTPQANIPDDEQGRLKYISDELNKIQIQFEQVASDLNTDIGIAFCDSVRTATAAMVDGDVLAYDPLEAKWCLGRRTRFLPQGYISGLTYQRGDEVANGAQISECLVDGATESPYIVPNGNEIQGYNGTLTDQQTNLRQIIFGQRYSFAITGYINNIRVYCFAGQETEVIIINDPTGSASVETLATVTPATDGWIEFGTGQRFVTSNTTFDVVARVGLLTDSPGQKDWTRELGYYTPQPYPNVTVNGVLAQDADHSAAVIDDNAYGVDITVQPAYIPTQWWVKVLVQGGGGIGGGSVIPTRPIVIFTPLTTYNVTLGDENALICTTSDFPVAFVLPDGGLPAGFITHVHQYGLGQVTVSATAPSTCVSSRSLLTRAQHSSLSVFNLGNGSYSVVGDQE